MLDDLGSTALNDFTTDKLFEIVDERYRSGKPLIVTTNLNPDEAWKSSIGMRRIFDRLREPVQAGGRGRGIAEESVLKDCDTMSPSKLGCAAIPGKRCAYSLALCFDYAASAFSANRILRLHIVL